ncbi:hypothetical protein [Microvirga antarctica]|uniref:hypothetical protein n=1 Tax=Microvirga antarctica TaxID=2819233 RepID=UPI001B304E5C|nr:hypothetical protein [Microvirga antarctica]
MLPPVKQVAEAYRGSVVLYPSGTCAQIKAAQSLFLRKNRVDYVGLHLWRQGFAVAERHWRPRLKRLGEWADRTLKILPWMVARSDRDEDAETLADKAAHFPLDNFVFSRIVRRLDSSELPMLFRVLIETATRTFESFETPVTGDTRSGDETAIIKAFDLGESERLNIMGNSPQWLEELPSVLQNLSSALALGTLASAADAPATEIAQARSDAANVLELVLALFEVFQWVFGDKAGGIRLSAWIARKAPDGFGDGIVLVMLRLRIVPGAILSSEEIAAMAMESRKMLCDVREIQRLGRDDHRFKIVFSKKEIRAALRDPISVKRWISAVEKARNGL